MAPPRYRIIFEIAVPKSSNEFLSAEETLNDYQILDGYDVTEEISIDRLGVRL